MKSVYIILMVLLLAGWSWAQSDTQAAIVGTATDPSGAMVPGANVTATNTSTGFAATATTDEKGDYRFSLLNPGTYKLDVDAHGFERSQIQDIVLNVGDVHRTDLHLKIGSANEVVTVSSTSAQINTETAERGDVVTSQDIAHLPLNGRQFLALAALEPGAVSGNPKRGVEQSKGVDVSFNGARGGYNSYYIDGATNTDPLYNTLQASPSLDAVAEFRVMTNMYSAQYGRAGGAIVSIVTKSGSNAFHGTAYEYLRNKALDALPVFYIGQRDKLANYLLNQYGGTIGGPIIKNKTFFFFSTEFSHQVTPGKELVGFAPTALERQGNLTQSINPWSGQPDQLMDPYTGQPIASNILPSSYINPVGQKLMDLWPQPNYSGDPFLNYRVFEGGRDTQRKFLGRVDHKISEKDNLSVTFDYDNYDNETSYFTAYGNKEDAEHNRTLAGSWTHMFTPQLINDFKSSFAWYLSGDQFVLNDKNYCASWGFDATTNTVPGTCRILFYTVGYQRFDIGNDGNFVHWNKSYYAKDNLVWVKGTHTLAFGGEFSRDMYKWQYEGGVTAYYFGLLDGDLNYGTGLNQYYGVTGSTFTDVLMGLPNHMYVGLGGSEGPLNMPLLRNVFGTYVQDDWKVTPRLTLNLGLRYDYEQPFADTNNQFMTFDYNTGLPVYAKGVPQNLLSQLSFKYETGGPNRPYSPNPRNFSPRFGFAWRPFGGNRTSVRGGYGMFYTTENASTTMYGSWVAPFQGQVYSTPGCPSCWPDGQRHLTTVDQVPYGLSYLRGANPGDFMPNAPYYPGSYVQQWNLTVARDLGGEFGVEVGYVGSTGTNLGGPASLQELFPSAYAKALANGLSNFTVQTKGFGSRYDALQATLHKNYSHGLRMLASYTWSHAITDASNDSANENLLNDVNANGNVVKKVWSNADFDVRHRLTVSGTYELPFGKDKAFGNNWNRALNGILGGWRSNLIYTYQTGFPFTVYMSNLELPDQTCSGALPRSQRTPTRWFDFSCFPSHQPTTYVNPITGKSSLIDLQGDARPNSITGPPTNDVDYGMEKYFHITERQTFQIRGEAFNLFNHANLIGPSGNYFFNSASGAEVTQARNGREVQVAVRYSF